MHSSHFTRALCAVCIWKAFVAAPGNTVMSRDPDMQWCSCIYDEAFEYQSVGEGIESVYGVALDVFELFSEWRRSSSCRQWLPSVAAHWLLDLCNMRFMGSHRPDAENGCWATKPWLIVMSTGNYWWKGGTMRVVYPG